MTDRLRNALRGGAVTVACAAVVGLGAVAFMSSTGRATGDADGGQFTIEVTSPQAGPDGRLVLAGESFQAIEVPDRDAITQEDLLGRADRAVRATVQVTSPDLAGPGWAELTEIAVTDQPHAGPRQDDDLWAMLCNRGMRTLAQCTEPFHLATASADPAAVAFRTNLRPEVDAFDLNVWLVAGGDQPSEPVPADVRLGFTAFTGTTDETLPDPYPEPPHDLVAEGAVLLAELGLGDGFVATVRPQLDEARHLRPDGGPSPELVGEAWHLVEDRAGRPIWAPVVGVVDVVVRGEVAGADGPVEHFATLADVALVGGTWALDLDALDPDGEPAAALATLQDAGARAIVEVVHGSRVSAHLLPKDQLLEGVGSLADGGLRLDLADAVDGERNGCHDLAVRPLCVALGDPFAALATAGPGPLASLVALAPGGEPADAPADGPEASPSDAPGDEPRADPDAEPSDDATGEPADDATPPSEPDGGRPSDAPSDEADAPTSDDTAASNR